MTAERLTVGQEVRLVRRTNRFTSDPPKVIGSGRVISVGRRYAYAEIEGSRSYEFDMTTGYERGDDNGNGLRVVSAVQVAAEKRHAEAVAVLKAHRLELGPGSPVTLEQIEAIGALLSEPGTTEGREDSAWHAGWEADSRDSDGNLILRYAPSGGLYRVIPVED